MTSYAIRPAGWNLAGLAGSASNLANVVNPLLGTYINFSKAFGLDDFVDYGSQGGTTAPPASGTAPAPATAPAPDYTPWIIGGTALVAVALVVLKRKR